MAGAQNIKPEWARPESEVDVMPFLSINPRRAWQTPWARYLACLVLLGGVTAGLSYRRLQGRFAAAAQPAGAYCDSGIGAARSYAARSMDAGGTAWAARINASQPPEPAPSGMVWVPGGQFWMGADDEHMAD